MEFNDKDVELISRAVTFFLAELRISQMKIVKQTELSQVKQASDIEWAATLLVDISDYVELRKKLDVCQESYWGL